MAVIKIDMDGVVRDIFTPMLELYNKEFGTRLNVHDITSYDVNIVFPKIRKRFGISAAEWFFDINSKLLFLESKTYHHVDKVIDDLRNIGHTVVIVTWQPLLKNKIDTLNFLERNNIHYDDICFTKDKWMINGDYLVDDNPEFILDEREKANKRIIMDFPYNRYINENEKFIRINDMNQLKHYI